MKAQKKRTIEDELAYEFGDVIIDDLSILDEEVFAECIEMEDE